MRFHGTRATRRRTGAIRRVTSAEAVSLGRTRIASRQSRPSLRRDGARRARCGGSTANAPGTRRQWRGRQRAGGPTARRATGPVARCSRGRRPPRCHGEAALPKELGARRAMLVVREPDLAALAGAAWVCSTAGLRRLRRGTLRTAQQLAHRVGSDRLIGACRPGGTCPSPGADLAGGRRMSRLFRCAVVPHWPRRRRRREYHGPDAGGQ